MVLWWCAKVRGGKRGGGPPGGPGAATACGGRVGQSVGQGAEDAAQQAAGSGGRHSSGQEGRAHQEASGLRPGGGDQEGKDHPVNNYMTVYKRLCGFNLPHDLHLNKPNMRAQL